MVGHEEAVRLLGSTDKFLIVFGFDLDVYRKKCLEIFEILSGIASTALEELENDQGWL